MKAKEKKQVSESLIRAFAMKLSDIHPKLPPYFCGGDWVLVPIASGEDADQKMAELGLVRLDPNGHIDNDVLWAIYELMAENDDEWFRSSFPQITYKILTRALGDKNSKLSKAIAKAYGEE